MTAERSVPDAIRVQIEDMTRRVMDRCDELGIAWADFYTALLTERRLGPRTDVEDLFRRTFRRVGASDN